ncbi:MAG TPA: hypothetical protein VFB68_00485 [Xanthobacteraceae bacterium]|nr:hypothetical protein [Xanthobacteraceae bacterium]
MKTIVAMLLLASASIAFAQGVPTINIDPTCRAAAKGSAGMQQDYDSCRKSEEGARDVLAQQWTSFLAADRGSCYRLTTTGTPGTYTELLTCLEMKRDARKLPDNSTVGQGIGGVR